MNDMHLAGNRSTQHRTAIDRCPDISFKEFSRRYQKPGIPVILPNFCHHWTAMKTWSLDHLVERSGHRQLSFGGAMTPFADVIARLKASGPDNPQPYFKDNSMFINFPELLPDIMPIPGNRHNRLRSKLLPSWEKYRDGVPELLIAAPGTYFPILHYDLHRFQAFITQIKGDKEFTIYPPDQIKYLYPRSDKRNISQIDRLDTVDLERFPLFAKAEHWRFTLREGETVFIPDGWWHYTRILSPSLAVTWNTVIADNWQRHIDELYFGQVKQQPAKDWVKRLYLAMVGTMLRVREMLLSP